MAVLPVQTDADADEVDEAACGAASPPEKRRLHRNGARILNVWLGGRKHVK